MTLLSLLRSRLALLAHPQFFRHPLNAIFRRLLWMCWARRLPTLTFATEYGFAVQGDPRDIGIGSLYYRGRYEWAEIEIWKSLLVRDDMVVLDVGANLGLYSLLSVARSRALGLKGIGVYGFEPNPKEFSKFQRNIQMNGYAEIAALPVAVSSAVGSARMAIPPRGLGVFGHLLTEGERRASVDDETDVETTTIDTWCADHGIQCIDLMKLDVEGYERQVLKGAAAFLSSQRIRVLLMEIGHGEWRECVQDLYAYGYIVKTIQNDGTLSEFSGGATPSGWNVLAVPAGGQELSGMERFFSMLPAKG